MVLAVAPGVPVAVGAGIEPGSAARGAECLLLAWPSARPWRLGGGDGLRHGREGARRRRGPAWGSGPAEAPEWPTRQRGGDGGPEHPRRLRGRKAPAGADDYRDQRSGGGVTGVEDGAGGGDVLGRRRGQSRWREPTTGRCRSRERTLLLPRLRRRARRPRAPDRYRSCFLPLLPKPTSPE